MLNLHLRRDMSLVLSWPLFVFQNHQYGKHECSMAATKADDCTIIICGQ